LLLNPPSNEEMKNFFAKERDQFEIQRAKEAARKVLPDREAKEGGK
jgi:hypothetical protein